jgi:hypothetical protein
LPLDRQNVPISFSQGLDLKNDYKQIMPGKWLTLENVHFQTPGELRKRNGYEPYTTAAHGPTITTGTGVSVYNNELILMSGQGLYSFSPTTDLWIYKGGQTSFQTTDTQIVNDSTIKGISDTATSGQLSIIVWPDGGVLDEGTNVRYSVRDNITGTLIIDGAYTGITDAQNTGVIRVFALSTYFIIMYYTEVDNTIQYIAISVSNPYAPILFGAAASDNFVNTLFDGVVYNDTLYFVYLNTAGTEVNVNTISNALVVGGAATIANSPATNGLTIFTDSVLNQAWVSWITASGNIQYSVLTLPGLTPFLASTTISGLYDAGYGVNAVGVASNGAGTIWVTQYVTETPEPVFTPFITAYVTATNIAPTQTVLPFYRGTFIYARPFVYNSVTYLPIAWNSTLQSTLFIIDATAHTVIGRLLYGQLWTTQDANLQTNPPTFTPPNVSNPSSGVYNLAATQTGLEFNTTYATEVGLVTLDFNSQTNYQSLQAAGALLITGGMGRQYDGAVASEQGFNLFPEGVTSTASNTGGHLGNASVPTTYQYSIVYSWTSTEGQINYSFPSIPDNATTRTFSAGVTTGSVTLTIPTLRLTERGNAIISVYRTEGNGTTFYLVNTNNIIGNASYLPNNIEVDYVTYVDTTPDSSLISNPQLYTTGSVVGNDPMPPANAIALYKNRVMLVPSENPLQLWYSKTITQGVPIEFSEEFVQQVDERDGNIITIAPLDDKLIIFKAHTIFYMTGEGPDNTGAQDDFSPAQLIATDTGCSDVRSVVFSPVGLMFKSEKGIYLLDRSLQATYIGAPVEAYNSQTVISATLLTASNKIHFALESGPTLVYDYFVQQWSVYTGVFNSFPPIQATVFNENYTFVSSDGRVWEETPGIFLDATAPISMKLVTGWLSMAQLQGFERVRRMLILGEYISAHTLTVQIAYDFNTGYAQTDNIAVTSNPAPYQWRIDFERQKCQAIQFSLQDTPTAPYGESLSLSAFNLMVGVKKGTNKVVPALIYS